MTGRPMNENTKRMLALGVGESTFIRGVTIYGLHGLRKTLNKNRVKVRMAGKSNVVRVERIA